MFARVQSILHPTDFSEYSHHAFEMACALARDYQAQLVVMHVAELPVTLICPESTGWAAPVELEPLEARLRQIVPNDPGIRVEYIFVEGDPAREILRTAKRLGCDLIVMGTHGRSGLNRLVVGSIADQVVRLATCPVLTVSPSAMAKKEDSSAAVEKSPVVCEAPIG
jgi:nucleotide-binding universal stress UspA family protein